MNNELGINEPSKNPLMSFVRKPVLSVKLPSNGAWYDSDMIDYNAIGEVEILPMLPSDELLLLNPYELVSGNAIMELIKSCCPSIKNPKDLYYPDANVLLLGIKKASYGDEIKQSGICPHCWQKMKEVEQDIVTQYLVENYANKTVDETELKKAYKNCEPKIKEKISDMEKNGEIISHQQEFSYSIDELLNSMTLLPKEKVIETSDGLKIYVTPYKCSDKVIVANQEIKKQKFLSIMRNADNNELSDNEKEVKGNEFRQSFLELTNELNKVIASSTKYIILPNGDIIDNKEYIKEYITYIDPTTYAQILESINELNNCGTPSTIEMECECCGHQWDEKFFGFNQSDFFGISS